MFTACIVYPNLRHVRFCSRAFLLACVFARLLSKNITVPAA
jgi:hypothetical protein